MEEEFSRRTTDYRNEFAPVVALADVVPALIQTLRAGRIDAFSHIVEKLQSMSTRELHSGMQYSYVRSDVEAASLQFHF